jgi:hypothetical protein
VPLKKYRHINFKPETQLVVDEIVRIVESYREQGYQLTSRQLYYRFVALDLFPAGRKWSRDANDKWQRDENGTVNAEPNYKWICSIIADARIAGLVDWNSIEDRTREPEIPKSWENPAEIVSACADQFQIDKWVDQPYRVEVWVEKDALEGIVEQVCRRLFVTSFSCRGYTSATAIWKAGQRLKQYAEAGQTPVILHLGDHDPSGVDMSRDIQKRVSLFMDEEYGSLMFQRIALTREQIRQYRPPPNPAKVADSRAEAYIEEHGVNCWELDALEPAVLSTLIEEKVLNFRNEKKFKAKVKEEKQHLADLRRVADNWDEVVENLR